jgi:hypothetical protein
MCLSFDNIEVENVFAGEGGLKMGEWRMGGWNGKW